MENRFFHRLSSILWGGIVILIVLLAVYVSVGRLLAANMEAYRTEILQELNARVPFTIEAEQVSGEWQSFSPTLVLTNLRLSFPGGTSSPLELSEGRIGLNILSTLLTRTLQLTRVELAELNLHGELSSTGKLRLTGFDGSGGGEVAGQIREFILNVEMMALRNNRLMLTMPSGEVRDLALDLLLSREGSLRHMEAQLTSTRGAAITVLAEGVGDPFQPDLFAGQMYLDIQSTDLGAVRDIFADQALPVWAEGALNLQLWLDWDRGSSSVEARVEGSDLMVADQDVSWRVPFDRIALQARLQQNQDNWTLFISDLQVENDDTYLTLPRLQLDARDNALRIRAHDVPLAPISALLSELEAMPEASREVLAALQPRGHLSSLQVEIDDLDQATKEWEVEANFSTVSVDSFAGAPGITAATGYVNIVPGSGYVVLDSQGFELEFPTIYQQPLQFDDLYGTVNLEWDSATFDLASGLLTTQGKEGTAKVLFGLNIPLVSSDIGIEMDLLVGLENLHPSHRAKYVPSILNPSLRAWLSESIGDGRINKGAFLWRGSLRSNSAPLRTVQLAFNVEDTQLNYHSQWPPVMVEDGIILIDDSRVSVWADRAQIFNSTVERLSVETRLNASNQITLSVDAGVMGPAEDGLKVLNESPLAGIVGKTFASWGVSGHLETDLSLRMNLSDKSVAPWVEVSTRWRGVDMLVMPGNLPLQAVSGEFDYSTSNGFSSRALKGELWGKAVSVDLEPHHIAESKGYDPATSALYIKLVTEVDMAELRHWSGLEPLAFVSGNAAADIGIKLVPGEPPTLTVDSDLLGVSLDLPRPWSKAADESRNMHLEMPLVQDHMPMSLQLGSDLQLRLDLAQSVVRGGSLGINEIAFPAEEGELRVAGHAPLVHVDDWLDFVTRYFSQNASLSSAVPYSVAQVEEGPVSEPMTMESGIDERAQGAKFSALELVIDELSADELVVMDQHLQDVVLNLALESTRWRFAMDTDWLRGELLSKRDDGPMDLSIEHLDLDRLPDFSLTGDGRDSPQDLPPVNITLSNLSQSGRRLGELSFLMSGRNGVFTLDRIIGELAHLTLPAESPAHLIWYQGDDGGSTELRASLSFEDLGRTLEYFGYQRIVETGSGDFELKLQWPGSPADFSLRDGQGSVQVRIGQGSFLEAPAGTVDALRVVGILNLTDIVRRLSLANNFESGIPFDTVDGEIFLDEGTLEVVRMDVDGSSSFRFSGVSDVEKKSLRGELVATLPVASNLPWIAALAVSLPVAAAGVYVVSRVFDSQINRLSSAVYSVGGTWSEPEVKFDHIFDTKKGVSGTNRGAAVNDDGTGVGDVIGESLPANGSGEALSPAQSGAP